MTNTNSCTILDRTTLNIMNRPEQGSAEAEALFRAVHPLLFVDGSRWVVGSGIAVVVQGRQQPRADIAEALDAVAENFEALRDPNREVRVNVDIRPGRSSQVTLRRRRNGFISFVFASCSWSLAAETVGVVERSQRAGR